MVQVTSGKMTADIMKIVNALWTKTNSKSLKICLKIFYASKLKRNAEMSDEKHLDSLLSWRGRNGREKLVAVVGILTKLKQAEILDPKMKS